MVHRLAKDLAGYIEEADIDLLTLKGIVTWERGHSSSTIDLAFSTIGLVNRLVLYKVEKDINAKLDCNLVVIRIADKAALKIEQEELRA